MIFCRVSNSTFAALLLPLAFVMRVACQSCICQFLTVQFLHNYVNAYVFYFDFRSCTEFHIWYDYKGISSVQALV